MLPRVSAPRKKDPHPTGVRAPLTGGFLLLAAPHGWREACFAVPAVRAIRYSRRSATIGVICPEEQEPLWEDVNVDRIIPYPVGASARRIVGLLRDQSERWNSVVLWEAGAVADACARLAIPERCGRPTPDLVNRLTRVVETPAKALGPVEHRVRSFLDLVQALGVEAFVPRNFEPAPPVSRVLAGVLLAPDSDYGPSHEWQVERWIEVARAARQTSGLRVTVAGLAGGRGLGRAVAAAMGEDDAVFIELEPLGGGLPVLAAHGVCVSADSSLAHLAAHVGCLCVTLFGPNDPAWRRPLGRRHSVVRHHVECAPCLLGKCPFDRRCQQELSTHVVIDALCGKIAESRNSGAD